MKALLITLNIFCFFPSFAQEYSAALMVAKMDIDSAWTQTVAPAPDKIRLPNSSNLLRQKNMSNRECIKLSMATAMKQGPEAAMPWMLAAFCHNQPAQDRVSKAGPEAIRYAMNTYGEGEKATAGYVAPPNTATAPVELTVNFTNKTGEILYMFSLITDEADGKRDCKDYKYMGSLAANRSHLAVLSKGKYIWIRFADKKANDGCTTYMKEHKIGPGADQTASSSTEIFIQ